MRLFPNLSCDSYSFVILTRPLLKLETVRLWKDWEGPMLHRTMRK